MMKPGCERAGSVLRNAMKWQLYSGAPLEPTAEVMIDQEIAWRLFTHGLSQNAAREHIIFKGDQGLGLKILEMVSIIA